MDVPNHPNPTLSVSPSKPFGKNKIVQRVEKEFNDISISPIPSLSVFKYPLKPFQWHFVYKGSQGTPFEGGEYHGDILFKDMFPFNPPLIAFSTYNGRILRGQKVSLIEPRWWDSSMSIRTVLQELVSVFEKGTPRPSGSLFEETYRLKVLAERSKFSGCAFCQKRERLVGSDQEYVAAFERWREMEKDTKSEGIGQWWHELREIVIKNEERELEEIEKRKYDSCVERVCSKFNAYLILFNWKTLARHVLAPIIYRFFLMAALSICFIMLIILAVTDEFDGLIRALAIVDLVAVFLIALQECGAIYAFILSRQLRGHIRSISRVVGTVSFAAIFVHLILAIIIAATALDEKYEKYKTEVIIYVATAFGNDFYHYTMGILFYLNIMFFYIGRALEYVFTGKISEFRKRYKGKLEKYPEINKDRREIRIEICNICKEQLRPGDEVYNLECDKGHVYHKECLQEVYAKFQRCPMCKKRIELAPETAPVHIKIIE